MAAQIPSGTIKALGIAPRPGFSQLVASSLNLALVTAPTENSQVTTAAFARAPLYGALPQTHVAAQKKDITLQDLAKDDWILFARRAHPVVHDAIMEAARREGIAVR